MTESGTTQTAKLTSTIFYCLLGSCCQVRKYLLSLISLIKGWHSYSCCHA